MYKHLLALTLGAVLLVVSPVMTHAYATVDIWNTPEKPVYERGDVIKVLIQHTLDESFSEVMFVSKGGTIYSSEMSNDPFEIQYMSPAPDRKEIHVTFTVPENFSSNDTSFFFSARFFKNGQPYTQAGNDYIAVRGIPKIIAPKNNAKVKGFVDFEWNRVLGASSYQFQLTRSTDGIKPKDSPEAIITVLDTTVTTNSIILPMLFTGEHHWTVRANVDGIWGEWITLVQFEVEAVASVASRINNRSLLLYPQPARTTVNIVNSIGRVRNADIYDLTGKLISHHGHISGSMSQFNVVGLSSGRYQVVLTLDDSIITLPLIVD